MSYAAKVCILVSGKVFLMPLKSLLFRLSNGDKTFGPEEMLLLGSMLIPMHHLLTPIQP
jgi:hypothetical protein